MITRSMDLCPKGGKERLKIEAREKRIRQAREQSVYTQECMLAKKRAQRSIHHSGMGKKRKRKSSGGEEVEVSGSSGKMSAGDVSVQTKKARVGDSWVPPVSPYGLLEEELYRDPWKLLVSCMLLNKTTAVQVRSMIYSFFDAYPTPERLCDANIGDLERVLMPLGLYRKRAQSIQRFSQEYLTTDWKDDPTLLYGIGKYAKDAYDIFCLGKWRDVTPEDKDLRLYVGFLERTDGLGVGFDRFDDPMDASS